MTPPSEGAEEEVGNCHQAHEIPPRLVVARLPRLAAALAFDLATTKASDGEEVANLSIWVGSSEVSQRAHVGVVPTKA